jgi:hypothetical protein
MTDELSISNNTLDDRLGVRDETGAVVKWPAQYIHGQPFLRRSHPAPSMTYLGLDKRFFVVYPLFLDKIPASIREELEDNISRYLGGSTVTTEPVSAAETLPMVTETKSRANRTVSGGSVVVTSTESTGAADKVETPNEG